MRIYKLLPFIFVIFLITSKCKTIDEWTHFDIEYNKTITIAATTRINIPINIPTPPIPTNSKSEFEVNNTAKNLIEEIKLKSLKLSILEPEGRNFGFLKSIEVYISADGLPEKKIAWNDNIPDSVGNIIKLNRSDANLKDYILKDKIYLRLKTVTDEILGSDYKIEVNSVFFVDARILGI